MIFLRHDASTRTDILHVDSHTAGVLQHLLTVARPQGEAAGGDLIVVVYNGELPPNQPNPTRVLP